MVNALLNGIFNLVIGLVSLILAPIDSLINATIPAFNDVLTLFGNFITYIGGFIPFALSWLNIPSVVLTFVCYYFIAKISISASIHVVKLALAWWRTLKP